MSTTQPIKNTEQLKMFKEYYLHENPHSRNYLLVIVGLNSALRISDILSLTYGDIYHFKTGKWKSHIIVTERKTKKINRIYINEEIRDALQKCTNPIEMTPSSWLFPSQMQKKNPLSRYQAYRIIKHAAHFAGFDGNISCHSLRKTFGYHA